MGRNYGTMNELEQRAFCFDISAEETENGNIITGRLIVYNSHTN